MMPTWKFVGGAILVVAASLAGLLLCLVPEIQMLKHPSARRWAWIPSVALLGLAGFALGVSAAAQMSLTPPKKTALGLMVLVAAGWPTIAGCLAQFDRTLRLGRRLFRAFLVVAVGFSCGMIVGPLLPGVGHRPDRAVPRAESGAASQEAA